MESRDLLVLEPGARGKRGRLRHVEVSVHDLDFFSKTKRIKEEKINQDGFFLPLEFIDQIADPLVHQRTHSPLQTLTLTGTP